MDEPDIRMLAARVPTSPQGRYDDGIPEKPAPGSMYDVAGRRCLDAMTGAFVPGPHYQGLAKLDFMASKKGRRKQETDDNGSTEATD